MRTKIAGKIITVHSSVLFDPKKKQFVKNVSIKVDRERGSIVEVYTRPSDDEVDALRDGDIDLRGQVVMPGFVDAHTHIFLHPYRLVCPQASTVYELAFIHRS